MDILIALSLSACVGLGHPNCTFFMPFIPLFQNQRFSMRQFRNTTYASSLHSVCAYEEPEYVPRVAFPHHKCLVSLLFADLLDHNKSRIGRKVGSFTWSS